MFVNESLRAIRSHAVKLDGTPDDYDAFMEQVGDRSLVLLGEATRGTCEFYRVRADITRRLIEEKDFDTVAVEADWEDAYRLSRFIHGDGDNDPRIALDDFRHFPEWMWWNQEVLEFIGWLGNHNKIRPCSAHVGFYGLDLYSLYRSAHTVIAYLKEFDTEQAKIARQIYDRLDHVGKPPPYANEVIHGLHPQPPETLLRQLRDIHERSYHYPIREESLSPEWRFFADQSIRVGLNASVYYRAMITSRRDMWNLRAKHMADTLFALQRHRLAAGGSGRIIVWTHNSQVGDARATEMGWTGDQNLGQQIRARTTRDERLLVGFTTYTGCVAAADDWDGAVDMYWLRPAPKGSIEHLFHSSFLIGFICR